MLWILLSCMVLLIYVDRDCVEQHELYFCLTGLSCMDYVDLFV